MSSISELDGISIIGVGHCLPTKVLTNEELCKNLDVTPEWIVEKTGIESRFVAGDDDTLSDYATKAARNALEMANISADEIDLIIVATFSGDYIYPPVSAKVQANLNAKSAQIFDIQANCTGFVTGLTVASDRMKLDKDIRNAIVVGADFCTRYIDGSDVNTSIFLADGAGAAVLGRAAPNQGIMASTFATDSSNYESVRMRGGGSSFTTNNRKFDPEIDLMEMNGIATWKQAITHLPTTIRRACAKSEVAIEDVDFFVFHQANLRLIEYLMAKMRCPFSKTYMNVQRVGNSGAASLPVALSEACQKGLLKKGDTVVLAGVGAGFNFGASVWKWNGLG